MQDEAFMAENETPECPMPEPFSERVGMTVALAWLFYLGFVTRILFSPLLPAMEADLGFSHAQAGTLFLMISLGYLAAPLCSGLLSSRIFHRGNLNVSAWLVGLSLLPFYIVDNIWLVRGLCMLAGLAAGIHLPSAIATITGEIRKQDWGKALSIHQAAPPLSFVSAPLVAALLMQWVSWRMVLVIWGGLALVSALGYSIAAKGGAFPGKLPNQPNVKAVLSLPSFWLLVALFAMAMGGNAGIYAMLPLYLVKERSMDLAYANTLVGLCQLSGLVMVFFAGWITDRLGQKPTMGMMLLAGGIFTLLMGVARGGWLVAVIFIQPALIASFFPGAFAALARIAPPYLRSVTSALGPPISFLLGGGVLPSVIGYLGESYTFAAGIMLAGGVMLFAPVLVFFLRLGQYDDQAGC